jgi:hypothetical protein
MNEGGMHMSKQTVTRLFVGSLIAIVVGIVLATVGVGLTIGAGAFEGSRPDLPAIDATRFSATAIVAIVFGGLGIVGGAIGQFVAWIGAVVNTSRLEDKLWFILLLVLGLLSFGFIAMLVYVLAGPDGTRSTVQRHAYSGTAA